MSAMYSPASTDDQATRVRPRRGMSEQPARKLSSGPANTPGSGRTPFERVSSRARMNWLIGDALALVALLGLLLVALLPTFGWGWVAVTVAGGGVLGTVIGWLGWRFRLNSALVLAALAVAWFVFGTVLAMPSSGTAKVIPSTRSLWGLLTGPVTAPKAVLTLDPPIGETWNLLTVPLLLALVGTVTSVSLSLRSRQPALAWLPPVLAIAAAWAFGTARTHAPSWVAVATVALVLVWTAARRRVIRETLVAQRRRFNPLSALIGLVVLLVAGGLTLLAAGPTAPTEPRAVARHAVSPPLEVHRYTSPLQGMRGVLSQHKDDVMMTVNGAPAGSIIRVATMDTYDGLTFSVTDSTSPVPGQGQFRRIGARILDETAGEQATITIELSGYASVWVPTVGQSTAITVGGPSSVAVNDTLFYNKVTGTAVTTSGVGSGNSVALGALVAARPSNEAISAASAGSVTQQPIGALPDAIKDLAVNWTQGSATKGQAALEIEKQLKLGYFSNGLEDQTPSLSGHSLARLESLVAKPNEMVGDEEQYAAAMALMARQLSIPSRVVYGYRTPTSGDGDIRGRDVGAWAELNLEGLGWVRFDPTPDHNRTLKNKTQETPPKPRPHVDNPPPVPKKPDAPPPDNDLPVQQAPTPPPEPQIDWKRIGTIAAVFGIPIVALVGPIVLVLGLKGRRRRTRRHAAQVPNRVAGAWAELVDKARDLGRSPAPTATRSEQAEMMAVQFGKLIEQADPIGLAKKADSVVFSPDAISEEQAEHYWQTMREAERGVRRSVSPFAWIRGRLSTKSFRRYKG